MQIENVVSTLRPRDPILAKQLSLASRYPDKPVIRRVLALRLDVIGAAT